MAKQIEGVYENVLRCARREFLEKGFALASLRDIAKVRHIQHLSQNEGINLEGVRRILALESELDSLRQQVARLTEVLQELQLLPEGTRVFTAGQSGQVHLGRTRQRTQRAISVG